MTPAELHRFCSLPDQAQALLQAAVSRLGLSARAYHRVLKVARTIADLEGATNLRTEHVAEAIQYRSLDRLVRI
jgi:magnesium chelatase family protein